MQSELLVTGINCLEIQFVDLPHERLTEVEVAASDYRARKNLFESVDSSLFEVSRYMSRSQPNVEHICRLLNWSMRRLSQHGMTDGQCFATTNTSRVDVCCSWSFHDFSILVSGYGRRAAQISSALA